MGVSKTFASEKVERSRCLQWAIMMPVWQIPPRESTCKGVSTSSPHQLDLCLVWDEPKTIPNDSEWEKIAMKSTPELSLVLVKRPKTSNTYWTLESLICSTQPRMTST